MSAPPEPTILRPLGPLELFSSSRHNLGIYRCVTVTCRYELPSLPPHPAGHPIWASLSQLIFYHPMLRVGIIDQETPAAKWVHIPRINLREHVRFLSIEGGEGYEKALTDIHASCDDQFWEDLETRPPWRVTIVTPKSQDPKNPIEDIIFAFHHSLMDGTSGKQFHQYLLGAFNSHYLHKPYTFLQSEEEFIFDCPSPTALPEPQDNVIPFRNSPFFLARTLWSAFGPSFLQSSKSPIWGGKLIDFSHPHHTRVKPVDISPEVVKTMVRECQKNKTSVTGLLQALCLASFVTHVELEPGVGFISSTPINLRPYMSPTANPDTKDTFRILITSMDHNFSPSIIKTFRNPSVDLTTTIWDTARNIKKDILTRTKTLPTNDPVSLAKHITWSSDFWREKDGTPRASTWEVSNIGTVDNDAVKQGQRRISRILFTNGAMIAGPAVGVNVASVKGGILTVGISWNQGVVETELVDELAEDLSRFTRALHDCGRFTN